MGMMKVAAEFRDPVHGYIHASIVERNLIDTDIFQRLRRIRQLSGAHLTYPGAQHTRFEHSVGAMHLAGLAAEHFRSKEDLEEDAAHEMRIAALLHDIGHGPFSHLIEEVMAEKTNITHEDVAIRVIKETEIKDVLESNGYNRNDLAQLSIGSSLDRPKFVNELLGGGLSVDIMDYLLRDSYFTGVEYGKVDVHRIINSFEIFEGSLAMNQAAQYAFEALLIARFEMFRAVYFHRTVRAAEIMLIRSISLADDVLRLTDTSDLDKYFLLTDEVALQKLVDMPTSGKTDLKQARQLAMDYRDRKLLKCVFEKAVHRKDRFIERIFNQKTFRESLGSEIAKDAGVEPDDVYLDVPTTPSVPLTSSREDLSSVVLVSKTSDADDFQSVSVNEMPLLGAISGYFDMIRVYTTNEKREKVEKAVESFFGKESFATRISM